MPLNIEELLLESPLLSKALLGAISGGVIGTPLHYYLTPKKDRSLLESAGVGIGSGVGVGVGSELGTRLGGMLTD